jgi:hypothetical protein
MTFKKGIFTHHRPIKIMCNEWGKDGHFYCSYTNIHPLVGIMLSCSNLINHLTFHEVDLPLDPLYVYKKYGVDKNDPEAWSYVAKEAREIMSFMSGLPKVEEGWKELVAFEDSECNKQKIFDVKLFARRCKKELKDDCKKTIDGMKKAGSSIKKKSNIINVGIKKKAL